MFTISHRKDNCFEILRKLVPSLLPGQFYFCFFSNCRLNLYPALLLVIVKMKIVIVTILELSLKLKERVTLARSDSVQMLKNDGFNFKQDQTPDLKIFFT